MQDYDPDHFMFVRNTRLRPHHFADKQPSPLLNFALVVVFGVAAGMLAIWLGHYFQ